MVVKREIDNSNPYAPVTSFSGSDMIVDVIFPDVKPINLGTATTVTYSTFREMHQVRTLGRISPKGVTRGGRTIGGTMIFTVINQHFVNNIREKVPYLKKYAKIKPDELPPFDIMITFANEYGQTAKMAIYGLTFMEDSKTLSIEDLFTENVLSYIARDIEHMDGPITSERTIYIRQGQEFNDEAPTGAAAFQINQVASNANYQEYLDRYAE